MGPPRREQNANFDLEFNSYSIVKRRARENWGHNQLRVESDGRKEPSAAKPGGAEFPDATVIHDEKRIIASGLLGFHEDQVPIVQYQPFSIEADDGHGVVRFALELTYDHNSQVVDERCRPHGARRTLRLRNPRNPRLRR